MKTLYESILGNIEDTIKQGDDIIIKKHILDQLHDIELYEYDNWADDEEAFNIYKKDNKWFVDTKIPFTCRCNAKGELTDGTFSFGIAFDDFVISRYDKPCPLKSLKYGPTAVKGVSRFEISGCPNIKDLKHCPTIVNSINITSTGITTLKYFPKKCNVVIIDSNKQLTNLSDLKPCDIKKFLRIQRNGIITDENTLNTLKWKLTGNEWSCYFDNSNKFKYF
jgi:hypothetical protein